MTPAGVVSFPCKTVQLCSAPLATRNIKVRCKEIQNSSMRYVVLMQCPKEVHIFLQEYKWQDHLNLSYQILEFPKDMRRCRFVLPLVSLTNEVTEDFSGFLTMIRILMNQVCNLSSVFYVNVNPWNWIFLSRCGNEVGGVSVWNQVDNSISWNGCSLAGDRFWSTEIILTTFTI